MVLYKSIYEYAEAEYIVEKSRFIAHASPAETPDEAKLFVAEIKEKYKDATHNVPAFICGPGMEHQWQSDDGEPQGTSGMPVLKLISASELTNVVIVVTRYFGGILLGTGGLVRAYSDAAKEALLAAETGELVDCVMRKYSGIAYGDYDKVRFILEKNGITDYETEYGSEVAITAYIPVQLDEGITGEITDSTRGTCAPENLGTTQIVRNTESLNEA